MAIITHTLDKDLKAFAKALNIAVEAVVTKVVVDLHGKITKRTPVDTGLARASWMVNEGSSPEGVPVPNPDGTVPPPKDLQASDFNFTGTRPVYITSNLPYIEVLENGWSQQAPAGMVRVSLAEVQAEMEQLTAPPKP